MSLQNPSGERDMVTVPWRQRHYTNPAAFNWHTEAQPYLVEVKPFFVFIIDVMFSEIHQQNPHTRRRILISYSIKNTPTGFQHLRHEPSIVLDLTAGQRFIVLGLILPIRSLLLEPHCPPADCCVKSNPFVYVRTSSPGYGSIVLGKHF